MKAAFGLRLAPDFFFGAALFAALFIGFLAAGRRAPFFDLPFLAAIDESSNLMVTLSSVVHLASGARQREDAQAQYACQPFSLWRSAFSTGDVSAAQQRNFHASSARAASTSIFSMASAGCSFAAFA